MRGMFGETKQKRYLKVDVGSTDKDTLLGGGDPCQRTYV